MKRIITMAIAAAVLGLAAPAAAQPALDFTKPSDFVRALQKAGYRAELKKGSDGAPYIASATGGDDFTLQFYECDKLKLVCKSFEFFSWWKKQPHFSTAMVNKWNNTKRFMKAAIDDDGDLTQRVYGTGVGMTEANFLELLDWYAVQAGEMEKFLNTEAPPEPKK